MLRKYKVKDVGFLLSVRNQPHIVVISNRRRMLTFNELPRCDDTNHCIWIIHNEIDNCGYILAKHIGKNRTVISIALLEKYTNRGLGTRSIKEACWLLIEEYGMLEIIAEIYSDNAASQKAFRKAGFEIKNTVVVSDDRTKTVYVYKAPS
jgi:RimJ/RimL family protein N-acetyltransferase